MAINRVAHPFASYCPECSMVKERTDIACCRDHDGAAACDIRTCRDCLIDEAEAVFKESLGILESTFAEVVIARCDRTDLYIDAR